MPRAHWEDKVKLSVRHIFNCSMETFWAMFWDPDDGNRLEEETGVHREMLWLREEGPLKIYRMRFTPDSDLPGPVAKFAGTKKLVYEQENRLNTETHVLEWQVFPTVARDKITAKGTMTMRDVPNGVERLVEGDVKVRVPIIGRRIEKLVLNSVVTSYEHAAGITHKWLADRS